MIALPLLLALAAVLVAVVLGDEPAPTAAGADTPLALPAGPAPAAGSAECAALLAALPQRLPSGATQLDRRPLAAPVPQGTAAWGVDQTVILRCGLDRPAELTPTAPLLDVSGVRWLRLSGERNHTWVAVDRPVYLALSVPDDSGTGPLQDISTVISSTLPAQPVRSTR